MKKAGIPTRKVGALKTEKTISEGTQGAGSNDDHYDIELPKTRLKTLKQVSPSLFVAPTPKSKSSVQFE